MIILLYQKLLIGSKPFFISIGPGGPFEIHRHPELELSYCVTGSCDILCENKLYTLSAGDFALIPSMAAHEMPDGQDPTCQKITLEFGYALLGEHFGLLSERYEKCRVFRKQELGHTEHFSKLAALTEETLDAYRSASDYRDLTIKANLFKISELLLQLQEGAEPSQIKSRKLHDIKKIDKALETIYNSYFMPLNIESVSASCGYSKAISARSLKTSPATPSTIPLTATGSRSPAPCWGRPTIPSKELPRRPALPTPKASAGSSGKLWEKAPENTEKVWAQITKSVKKQRRKLRCFFILHNDRLLCKRAYRLR